MQLVFCNSIRMEVIVRSGKSCGPDVGELVRVGVTEEVGVGVLVGDGVILGVLEGVRVETEPLAK